MGRQVFKDESFFGWEIPILYGTVIFENCDFHDAHLIFSTDIKYIAFKNCTFSTGSTLCFRLGDGVVCFENCRFRGGTTIHGEIFRTGKVKFTKCEGLFDSRFDGLRNRSQTLTEMGLYQTFKSHVLSARKEETVYKKIGIYDNDSHVQVGCAIATLKIPKGIIRYGNKNSKCRCEKAIVTDIEGYSIVGFYSKMYEDTPFLFKYGSVRDRGFTVYEVGMEIKPNYFDHIPNICSYGIHYFYDRESAEAYDFS